MEKGLEKEAKEEGEEGEGGGEESEEPCFVDPSVSIGERMKSIMISGSRTLSKNGQTKLDVYEALDDLLEKNSELVLLSGGAIGVDKMGEQWARERGVQTIVYKPDYRRFKRGAPLIRNDRMLVDCDGVVAFWDGKSKGTKYVLDRAGGKLLVCVEYGGEKSG